MDRLRGETTFAGYLDALAGVEKAEAVAEYITVEKNAELRYTLGPVYSPESLDVQGEFANEEVLRKAIWQMNENGHRDIRRQHTAERIGTLRELFQWPFDHQVDLKLPDGTVTKSVTLPAGTVYAGVQWDENVWPDVKKGRIRGYSMGGRAIRMRGVDGTNLKKFS